MDLDLHTCSAVEWMTMYGTDSICLLYKHMLLHILNISCIDMFLHR